MTIYIFRTNMQLLRILSEKNSIYYVLFMLHYVLSNSKGKYCMNNVIMCMSILVDRGCVHNYYYLNGNFAFIACQENFAIQ